jgi:hypothetical protein
MKELLLILAALAVLGIVWKGFGGLRRRWRSGSENNWVNEAYLARQESGTWAESELAPGNGRNSAPNSVFGKIVE